MSVKLHNNLEENCSVSTTQTKLQLDSLSMTTFTLLFVSLLGGLCFQHLMIFIFILFSGCIVQLWKRFLRVIICFLCLRQRYNIHLSFSAYGSQNPVTYAQSYHQVIREGSDITIVGWGAQISVLEQACDAAAKVSGVYVINFIFLFL